MPAPTITPLPPAPSRSTDPATFATEADAFVGALPTFGTQANAQASYLDALAIAADADAVAAAASAVNAQGFANNAAASAAGAAAAADVSAWVSGATYAIGNCVFSPIDFQTYRRTTNGAGTTDPSVDAVNWLAITSPGGSIFKAVASGALSNGSTVVVNADGTVSVAAGVAQVAGTPVVFRSATTSHISATYDANAQKVVIAYQDNTGFGTAVVGTVSGTSISFGTPVAFNSANTSIISAVYDPNTQKVVIAYANNGSSGFGTAIVGTVSGTSISFGTAVVFESANTLFTTITYDTNAQKVVVVYRNGSTFGAARVGTVSGTSISFGTAVVFAASGDTRVMSATYDTNTQRVVIAYQEFNNSSFGTAVVGTVSGTNISFGTPVVFRSAAISVVAATYDANAQKVVIAYDISGGANAVVATVSGTSISFGTAVTFTASGVTSMSAIYDASVRKVVIAHRTSAGPGFGTAIVGTVSGTSISFGTAVVFESANTNVIATAYDSITQKVVIAYQDSGNSNFGTVSVFQNENTNFRSFIGFSNAAYTNGQIATIQVVGSVDDAQSALVPGQSYFVQINGTLGLTPATPSVFAGTAVATTKIIVKG